MNPLAITPAEPSLSVEQFTDFQAWYVGDLAHGVNAFVMDHPITKVPAVWKIVKGEPPYQVRKIGRIPDGSTLRRIALSFSIMSLPLSVP